MSSLVQHSNTPHYPQSNTMNSGESSALRQQRPTHNPSKNLHSQELQCLYDILGPNRVTLATAVAQILYANNGAWQKKACGVFCFVKDYDSRLYCFRLYDLKSRKAIYEETVHAGLRLDKGLDVFYTFDGSQCKVGINFVDRDEAQTFFHQFQSKQDDRQRKKKSNPSHKGSSSSGIAAIIQTPNNSSYNASSTLNGGGRASIVPTSTPLPMQTSAVPTLNSTPKSKQTKKNSGFFTLRGKKNSDRPDISAPIQATLVHVSHIGTKDSFFNDDAQKEMFEKVLANMHNISAEDKIYVREVIQNGGMDKLLAKPDPPPHDFSNQRPAPAPPEIPRRDYPTVGKTNGNRPPFQDVSTPASAFNQSNNPQRPTPLQGLFTPPTTTSAPAPAIPPRPGPRGPDNSAPPMQAPPPPPPPPPPYSGTPMSNFEMSRGQGPPAPPPPPPPPLPNDFWNHSAPISNGGPPPPPPPPPPLSNSSGPPSGLPSAAISSLNSGSARDNLLEDIRKGGTTRLKSAASRPPLQQQAPVSNSGESSPGAQDTMALNIMKILQERRRILIGNEDDKESDSSEDEWSN